LRQLHELVRPDSYFEIGVSEGATLALARCPAVAVDPAMQPRPAALSGRPITHLFRMTSDEFFRTCDLHTFFPDGVDFAFLDGMHRFEFLLRDFIGTERFCRKGSVVVLHDCHPVNVEMTEREHRLDARKDRATRKWWTGDVWKILPTLRKYRPDLFMTILDCPPTGLVVVTNLDPASTALRNSYDEIVSQHMPMTLEGYGLDRFRREFPTSESKRFAEGALLAQYVRRTSTNNVQRGLRANSANTGT
jgi:hypothetical protein